MKVCFETFGCRLSRSEALQQEAEYVAAGWTVTEGHSDADLIVIRGCSVTARAQRDCERVIEHIRRKYPLKRLVIEGCLPEAKKPQPFRLKPEPGADPLPDRTARAYLKVQDGCSCACTFCIVPQFRGASESVPLEKLMDKTRRFIDAGYREIVVTGCNLALYRDGSNHLPELVDALAELGAQDPSSLCRVRLGSVTPGPSASRLLDVMATRPNVCRYLHIPVQSGSERILIAMKRSYTVKSVERLVAEAREKVPDIAVACDLMSGFPGETQVDAASSLGLLNRSRFAKAHVFPYSERPGTIAAKMHGAVPRDIRRSRAHELAAAADALRSAYARTFIGKTVEMVVEDERYTAGWSSQYLWCVANAEGSADSRTIGASRKSLAKMRVKSVSGHVLAGDIVH